MMYFHRRSEPVDVSSRPGGGATTLTAATTTKKTAAGPERTARLIRR